MVPSKNDRLLSSPAGLMMNTTPTKNSSMAVNISMQPLNTTL